jgi:hypothetical protein
MGLGLGLGRIVIRAYKPNNPQDFKDIVFGSTKFVQAPTDWTDRILTLADPSKTTHLLSSIGLSNNASEQLYIFEGNQPNAMILSHSCELANSGLYYSSEDWFQVRPISPSQFPSYDLPKVSRALEASIALRVIGYEYYSRSLLLLDSSNGLLINCQGLQYVQLPIDADFGPLSPVPSDKTHDWIVTLGMDSKKNTTVLVSKYNDLTLCIVCESVSTSNKAL